MVWFIASSFSDTTSYLYLLFSFHLGPDSPGRVTTRQCHGHDSFYSENKRLAELSLSHPLDSHTLAEAGVIGVEGKEMAHLSGLSTTDHRIQFSLGGYLTPVGMPGALRHDRCVRENNVHGFTTAWVGPSPAC